MSAENRNTARRTHAVFHLTGKRLAGLDAIDALDLRPALLSRYRDLTALRYDFPLVLTNGVENPRDCVRSLSAVIDTLLGESAHDDDGQRMVAHVLRLERQVRTLTANGYTGPLSVLWNTAADRIAQSGDAESESLSRARAALRVHGEVVDCDAELPARLLTHVWTTVQEQKARRFHAIRDSLIAKLTDILRADFAQSHDARTPERLQRAVGGAHREEFDFDAMSRLLDTAMPKTPLSGNRRRRIQMILSLLESQGFCPATSFVFKSCADAIESYRARLPRVAELARALAMAELEVQGHYKEAKHDALFDDFDEAGVNAQDLALFPDYLVLLNADELDPIDQVALSELFAAGLPMKVLLQTDDLLDEGRPSDAHFAIGGTSKQIALAAVGMNDVYVLQAGASHIYQIRDRILDGFTYAGPALFHIFSGTGQASVLPGYLIAAAAMESRAFPAFTYDPSAGPDLASCFRVDANPQPGEDWPTHQFEYEDKDHQRVSEMLAFTLVDFLACDSRYTGHFVRVPPSDWTRPAIPASEAVSIDSTTQTDRLPYVLMVDERNRVQKLLVDDRVIREARRCRAMWRNLKQLGASAQEPTSDEKPSAEPPAVAASPPVSTSVVPPATSDDPYIETPRCTTCNECTHINPAMFAYNENRQAYVADPDAGTFAQLVEAAESCQVSIIHPGKPRNPNEPGLDDLLKRAEAFR